MATLEEHLTEAAHPNVSLNENSKSRSEERILLLAVSSLRPHPRNAAIYGEEDITSLAELIKKSFWVNELVVTPEYTIISGHRRWKAVQMLGWDTVPVVVREFPSELAELEALLLSNASREKTIEQKVREAFVWKEVEAYSAKQRQQHAAATTNQKLGRNGKTLQEIFPEASKGQTRDAIAKRVGLGSGRTYEKAAKVVSVIDELISIGNSDRAKALRKVLNSQSIEAATKLLKKPPQQLQKILSLIADGVAKNTKEAEILVRQPSVFNVNQERTELTTIYPNILRFSVGDLIKVNELAENFKWCIGVRGVVERIYLEKQQISVNLENGMTKIHFCPDSLTLITKAKLPSPYQVGDIVVVDIDYYEALSAVEKKWNGFWGIVDSVGEMGSIRVNVGSQLLQLFPCDLKPIDPPSPQLQYEANRILRLRALELDELEEKMLDVLQRRFWFTAHQLIHLENIEKLYQSSDL